MRRFSVKELALMAGVSVRTLHVYDKKGLLKPAIRTEAMYRLYGEAELLRLQQILFYKELDFSLQDIKDMLDNPAFDVVKALESHRTALLDRQNRLGILLHTIDITIFQLKNAPHNMNYESLYEGFTKEQAVAYRAEAVEKWEKNTIENAEKALLNMSKPDFEALKNQQTRLGEQLFALKDSSPSDAQVQTLIAQHYQLIAQFWGKQPDADGYIGLGETYVSDERYTMQQGVAQPDYARFLSQAMRHFAETQL
jgi:DNA-binding transcriptional MerR regulator